MVCVVGDATKEIRILDFRVCHSRMGHHPAGQVFFELESIDGTVPLSIEALTGMEYKYSVHDLIKPEIQLRAPMSRQTHGRLHVLDEDELIASIFGRYSDTVCDPPKFSRIIIQQLSYADIDERTILIEGLKSGFEAIVALPELADKPSSKRGTKRKPDLTSEFLDPQPRPKNVARPKDKGASKQRETVDTRAVDELSRDALAALGLTTAATVDLHEETHSTLAMLVGDMVPDGHEDVFHEASDGEVSIEVSCSDEEAPRDGEVEITVDAVEADAGPVQWWEQHIYQEGSFIKANDTGKQVERCWKVWVKRKDGDGISVIEPMAYGLPSSWLQRHSMLTCPGDTQF